MAPASLSEKDRQYIKEYGLTEDIIAAQLSIFQRGIPCTRLVRPGTVGDGITVLPEQDLATLAATHEQAALAGRVMKFVPASGAASRMFKLLLEHYHAAPTYRHLDDKEFAQFIAQRRQFAFYDAWQTTLQKQGMDIATCVAQQQFHTLLEALLLPHGLNYANLPKALLLFHRYPEHCRTPLEEHLVEAATYAQNREHVSRLHCTVSPEHEAAFKALLEQVRERYEHTGVRYLVTCSFQHPSTDTIAVGPDNTPFRDQQGRLVFRPGGHGALLDNLQELDADIVFLKNIDNVVPDHMKDITYTYKKALGGYLVTLQQQIFAYLEQLAKQAMSAAALADIFTFAREKLAIIPPDDMPRRPAEAQVRFLVAHLNRPLRVCGMVKNVGEPGGGPFWVEAADGSLSLQIVEASQVDTASAKQQELLASATHFNPVDLVCGIRDYQGRPFDLAQFRDPDTGFIADKTYEGRALKALELPGLWNGAMAHWNSVFVEVPLETFNPVKTVLDLLRPAHQP